MLFFVVIFTFVSPFLCQNTCQFENGVITGSKGDPAVTYQDQINGNAFTQLSASFHAAAIFVRKWRRGGHNLTFFGTYIHRVSHCFRIKYQKPFDLSAQLRKSYRFLKVFSLI